jgi:outer membrane receptor for ferrienterochelin and colicin
VIALAAVVAVAQTNSGSVTGRVVDASGAALPGVTVTATNTQTGFTRSVVTDAEGRYTFPSLPIGTYNVTGELSGFASLTTRNVEVQVATTRAVNMTMKQAAVAEQITVTAEAPLVATSPAIGTVVSNKEIENLPLNGRQFANLGTLAPGTNLMTNTDPTKPDQLVIAVNGGTGRNMNYLIDGGDNSDDTIGGALQNFNLEAVQEFKVQTQQYKAEYGRSTGGVLTVVTKGGTNDWSGSAYEYARRKGLNERTETEKLNGDPKSDYKRDQYGFAFGGPIVKDKAHFFATWEHTKKDTAYVVNTSGAVPEFDGQSFPIPLKNDLITAKSTVDLTAKQFLQVRYGYQKVTEKYGQSPGVTPRALGSLTNKYSSILGGHNWQIGSNKLNEFLVQWSKFDDVIVPDTNAPTIYYPSGGVDGQNPNTPQDTHQKKRQLKDDFSWSSALLNSHHDFKVGANYVDEPLLGGGFSTGTFGQYQMLTDNINGPVGEITVFSGNLSQSTPIKEYSGYAQDDWAVNPKLTVNLGVRYDLWTGYDLDQSSNPIWQTLTTQTKYNEAYLQRFRGSSGMKNDTNNWSPRLGFAYDLHGDAKNIVRAGFGRYYQMPYTNATLLFPASAVQSTYGVSYDFGNGKTPILNPDGSVYHFGQPLPPGGIIAGAGALPPNEVGSPDIAAPYSDQASLGYSWQANPWLGFSAEAVHINYRDLPYRFKANPFDPTTGKRRFPQFGNFRIWEGNGEAKYQGANLGVHARLGDNLELQGFYTLSQTTGNIVVGADEFRLTAADYQPDLRGAPVKDVSVDPYDPLCHACFGPLDNDARHRLTLSAVYKAPYGINVSGLYRYHSGTPYMIWSGADISCGPDQPNCNDGFALDLPAGVSHINAGRGASFQQLDARIGKEFRIPRGYGIEVMLEAFNLFNSKNPSGYISDGTPTRYAGDPNQGEQRLFQLGARIHF